MMGCWIYGYKDMDRGKTDGYKDMDRGKERLI